MGVFGGSDENATRSRRVERLLPLTSIEIDRYPFKRVLDFVAAFRNGVECRPIKVQRHPTKSGVWKIQDGRHRYMAMKLLGRTHIPVRHARTANVRAVPRVTLSEIEAGFRGRNL